eukprot:scaffold30431_cov31-Tisochrysis_lutea.AAC.3
MNMEHELELETRQSNIYCLVSGGMRPACIVHCAAKQNGESEIKRVTDAQKLVRVRPAGHLSQL